MSKTNLITAIVIVFLIASTAGAVAITYYGKVNTTLSVTKSAVSIDGLFYDTSVTDIVTAPFGGTVVYGPVHDLHNYGTTSLTLNWGYIFSPVGSESLITVKCVDSSTHNQITTVDAGSVSLFCFEYTLAPSIEPGIYHVTETLEV